MTRAGPCSHTVSGPAVRGACWMHPPKAENRRSVLLHPSPTGRSPSCPERCPRYPSRKSHLGPSFAGGDRLLNLSPPDSITVQHRNRLRAPNYSRNRKAQVPAPPRPCDLGPVAEPRGDRAPKHKARRKTPRGPTPPQLTPDPWPLHCFTFYCSEVSIP